MKKIILTPFAAALFCVGSMAQDSTSINNNLREGAQETEEAAEEAGNELRQDANEVQQDAEQQVDETKWTNRKFYFIILEIFLTMT